MRAGRYDMAKRWFEKEDSVYAYIVRNDSLSTDSIGLHHYKYHLMKAQHEQLENELRIARDIQMSMVPSTFPDFEGLDIMRHTTSENARRMIETLAAEVEKHRNGAEPNDDLTMMCIIKK